MPYTLLLLTSFFLSFVTSAQQTPLDILQRAFQTANTDPYIRFSSLNVNKNIFDDKDTTFTREHTTIHRDSRGKILLQNTIQLDRLNRPFFRTLYLKDVLYYFDLKDSTYSTKANPDNASGTLTDYLAQLRRVLNNYPEKIIQRQDTVIHTVPCYSFFINQYDTVQDNHHNYTYSYFYINKKTLLPVYLKELGAGNAGKGEYSLGRINVFDETYFEKYESLNLIDSSVFAFNLSGFDPENKTMLQEGSVAPKIQITDLNGKAIPASYFENKIVLVEFGSTTCPANMLTQPVISKLFNKYKPEEVVIICIYSTETPSQIQSYIEANHISFPIYLGNVSLKKLFKTISVPNFYLLSKNGIVIKAIEGYSDKLEEELISTIDYLKGNSVKL